MELFAKKFTGFINGALRLLFLFILIAILGIAGYYLKGLSNLNIMYLILVSILLCSFCTLSLFLFYIFTKNKINNKRSLIVILLVAFILRLLWILLVDTKPYSDFRVIYAAAEAYSKGSANMFKGTAYIGRFPHLTVMVIYLAALLKFFRDPLMTAKVINLIFSTINIYFIYIISCKLFHNEKKGLWTALIASLFPPFIIYNSVICSENIAMPFYLLSVYLFLLVINEKKNIALLLLSGFFLSIGNLFRMVGYVVLIAYVLYFIVYCRKMKPIRSCSLIVISFLIPLYLTNGILLGLNITEYPLWKGSEPNSTSILKGTNLKSYGTWNEEDARLTDLYKHDYKAIDAAAKAIIKERLTTTPPLKLALFYTIKFSAEWAYGDCGGVYLAIGYASVENGIFKFVSNIPFFAQIFYFILMLLVYFGLFNKKLYRENNSVNLLYIIFCGFGLLYLVTESQARYAYIISWVFVLLVPTACDLTFYKNKTKKYNQFMKFAMVGASNTLISLISYNILLYLSVNYMIANIIAYIIGMMNSYLFNSKWVFKESKKKESTVLKFMAVNLLALSISSLLLYLLVDIGGFNKTLSQLGVTFAVLCINYTASKLWTFKK